VSALQNRTQTKKLRAAGIYLPYGLCRVQRTRICLCCGGPSLVPTRGIAWNGSDAARYRIGRPEFCSERLTSSSSSVLGVQKTRCCLVRFHGHGPVPCTCRILALRNASNANLQRPATVTTQHHAVEYSIGSAHAGDYGLPIWYAIGRASE
jgi:hypothetical protein